MAGPRLRHVVFTINNPNCTLDEFKQRLSQLERVVYAIVQLERGEQGTPHFQGYMELNKQTQSSWLQGNLHRGMHVEKRRGTRRQAREYCQKEESRIEGPVEVGEWRAAAQGERTDLSEAVETLKEHGINAVAEAHTETFIKYSNGFANAAARLAPKSRSAPPKVYLLFGLPGCGKTRYVVDKYHPEDLYIHEPGSRWFDGYESQRVLMLDDFVGSASGFRLDYTLRLLDRYICRLPVKGSHVYLVAKKIYITTNIHPFQWFSWTGREVQYSALVRRIKHVICFKDNKPFYADRELFFAEPTGPIPGSHYQRPSELEESTDED